MLYKYKSINENLFSALINNELWFSNPNDFNDPYDCNLNYDFSSISYEKIYGYLLHLNEINVRKKSDSDLRGLAKYYQDNPDITEKFAKNFLEQEVIDKRGIFCLSEYDNILLMWSHYADSHKGVCLTFDTEKDVEFFKTRYKVEYPNDYPIIDPFSNNGGKEVQLLLATKSREWAYEKEVRIVKEKGIVPIYRGPVSFKPEALTEIKFGYKASIEQVRTIKNLVFDKYPHVKIYTSQIKNGRFGIEFYPIN